MLLSKHWTGTGIVLGYTFLFASLWTSKYTLPLCLTAPCIALLCFLCSVNKRHIGAREAVLIAVLTSLTTLSRFLFYFLPQIKPMSALVIVCGMSFGSEIGFSVGFFTILLSNFLFGQGIFTPFQMMALGTIGFLSGILFYEKKRKPTSIPVLIYSFLSVFLIYGLTVDTSGIAFLVRDGNLSEILGIYLAGIPFNLVHAASTVLFLVLLGNPFYRKCARANRQYRIFQRS